jgi:hypothetical protein
MAMQIGDDQASSGMTKDIYDKMDQLMAPAVPPANLEDARKGWRKLAFAIASGVVTHINNNMEVAGIQAQGNVSITVNGTVGGSQASLSGSTTVTTSQIAPSTGHVS